MFGLNISYSRLPCEIVAVPWQFVATRVPIQQFILNRQIFSVLDSIYIQSVGIHARTFQACRASFATSHAGVMITDDIIMSGKEGAIWYFW